MSEQSEIALGKENHEAIVAQYGGIYQDHSLNAYIAEIGAHLALASERPTLPWQFTVLNSPIANAFALPGGKLYITRGLLTLFQNESELAAVLGHEIGHVTARHALDQKTRQTLATLLVSGIGAATQSGSAEQLASTVSGLTLLQYSRNQEDEADQLGIRYSTAIGYSPYSMRNALTSLQNGAKLDAALSDDQETTETPSFLRTHPLTQDRITKTTALAAARPEHGKVTTEEAYDARLEGIIYGDSPEQGFIRGQDFIHPTMRFKFTFPTGYDATNTPAAIKIADKNGNIGIFSFLSEKKAPTGLAYLTKVKEANSLTSPIETTIVNGFPMARLQTHGTVNGSPAAIALGAIDWPNGGIVLVRFISKSADTARQGLDTLLASFKRLSPTEATHYKPYRLHITTVRTGDTIRSIAHSLPKTLKNPEAHLRALNDWTPQTQLKPGMTYRTIIER